MEINSYLDGFIMHQLIEQNEETHKIKNYYYQNKDKIDISKNEELAFRLCCTSGNLDLVKWIIEENPNTDISIKEEAPFIRSCMAGNLHIAKWLLSIKSDINISAQGEASFLTSCEHGHLHVAQWILSLKPNINILVHNEHAFVASCENGHLDVAKWLYSIRPDLEFIKSNELFCEKCLEGRLDFAKWLLPFNSDNSLFKYKLINSLFEYAEYEIITWLFEINKSNWNLEKWETIFITSCSSDNLNIAKLIYNNIPDLNIHSKDNHAFYLSCRNNCLNIFFWLTEIDPDIHLLKYESSSPNSLFLNTCKNGNFEIIQYFVNQNNYLSQKDIDEGLLGILEVSNFELTKYYFGLFNFSYDTINNAIEIACDFCHLGILKYIHKKYPNLKFTNKALCNVARHQKLKVFKWILQITPNIDISQNDYSIVYDAFYHSYKNNISFPKYLYKVFPNMKISDSLFNKICSSGKLKLVRWLLKVNTNINFEYDNCQCFISLSCYECLDILQIIYNMNKNISSEYNHAFQNAAFNGNVKIMNWIYNNINKNIDDLVIQESLKEACKYDYKETLEWLLDKFKSIDIFGNSPNYFEMISKYCSADIAEWLVTFNNCPYLLKYNEYGNFTGYIDVNKYKLKIKIIVPEEKKLIEKCNICHDSNSTVITTCKHYFCKYCILKWVLQNNKCPYCRSFISTSNIFSIK